MTPNADGAAAPDQQPSPQGQRAHIRKRWKIALYLLTGCLIAIAFTSWLYLDSATLHWLLPCAFYGALVAAVAGRMVTFPDEIQERMGWPGAGWLMRFGIAGGYVIHLSIMAFFLFSLLSTLGRAPDIANTGNIWSPDGLTLPWFLAIWLTLAGFVFGFIALVALGVASGIHRGSELRAALPRR